MSRTRTSQDSEESSQKQKLITLPWSEGESPKNANLMVPLKYPINISNLIPRDTVVTDAFGRCAQKTYDVTCFSSIKFVMTQLGYALRELNPDYHWRVYAYRSTRKTKEDEICNLRLHFNLDHTKKFIHVNVELWG